MAAEAGTRLRLAALAHHPLGFPLPPPPPPAVASEAPPLAEGLEAVARRRRTPNSASAHAGGRGRLGGSANYGGPEGAGGGWPMAVAAEGTSDR